MQRYGIISVGPAAAWQRVLGSACSDAQTTYGCVDWYLYQSSPAAAGDSTDLSGHAFAAPCSSILEHAAAAAGVAVTAAARTASPSPA